MNLDIGIAGIFGSATRMVSERVEGEVAGFANGPERQLLSALLFDGVQNYLNYLSPDLGVKRLRYREAYNWVNSKDTEYIFSFDYVCEALGIDPAALRLGLVNITLSQVNSKRAARYRRRHS